MKKRASREPQRRRKRTARPISWGEQSEHCEDRVNGVVLLRAEPISPCDRQEIATGRVWLDLGTGDGRFARWLASAHPMDRVIGVDACYANLREAMRRAPANASFLIADILELPPDVLATLTELAPQVAQVTINFPWGSLLRGLLPEDGRLLAKLTTFTQPGAVIEARLNGGALAEIGWQLDNAGQAIQRGLREAGFAMQAPIVLGAAELHAYPTTWAKRLAFGRDPRALYLRGVRT